MSVRLSISTPFQRTKGRGRSCGNCQGNVRLLGGRSHARPTRQTKDKRARLQRWFASIMSLIHLHPTDNVAIASRDLAPNARIRVGQVDMTLLESVRLGHKVAVRHIESGEPIVKFGQWIGFATETIAVGRWVHSHNLEAGQFARDAIPCSAVPPDPEPIPGRTFLGYRRSNGRAGTRNFLAIVSNVNCSASVCKAVARRYGPEILQRYPNVDGVGRYR